MYSVTLKIKKESAGSLALDSNKPIRDVTAGNNANGLTVCVNDFGYGIFFQKLKSFRDSHGHWDINHPKDFHFFLFGKIELLLRRNIRPGKKGNKMLSVHHTNEMIFFGADDNKRSFGHCISYLLTRTL